MKRFVMVLTLCILPSAVGAQTTTCFTYPGEIQCSTQGAPHFGYRPLNNYFPQTQIQPPDFSGLGRAIQALRERKANRAAQEESQERARHEREAVYLRQEVGRMVSEGDCDGAKNMALRYGDIELASVIPGLCP